MRLISLAVCLALAPPTAAAQLADFLPPGATYAEGVPKPADVLGFEVGEWHVRHDLLVRYMDVLAEASPRIRLIETGRTHEGRRLVLLAISSPANIERLESLRLAHLQEGETGKREDGPLVVWQGFSVHGNEASGSNASMLLAYHLAAGEGEVASLLEDTVVLLDPSVNPDGLARFAQWANGNRAAHAVADRNDREHNEAWPGGRTNHYWFDLNRDWLLLTHPESRARVAQFHRWRPHVLTDFHEMGSDGTYFFQPGVPERRHPLTPERNQQLTEAIGRYHAKALDAAGRLYYTEETFDDFYFGKGSTYPDINGSVGILFEQASPRGHTMDTVHGELSFVDAIGNQFRTALSTLEASDALRDDLREWQAGFWSEALAEAAKDEAGAVVIGDAGDPVRAAALTDILLRHGIEVYELAKSVEVGGRRYEPGAARVIPLAQRQYRLVKAVTEYRTEFQDETFYDVSAWNLPAAFNLPFGEVGTQAARGLVGAPVRDGAAPRGRFTPRPDAVAYAFDWVGYHAPRALQRLLDGDFSAYAVSRPLVVSTPNGEVPLGRGAVLIPLGLQPRSAPAARGTRAATESPRDRRADLEEVLAMIAELDGIDVVPVLTGLTPKGVDVGSPTVRRLAPVKPLLVVGDGVRAYEAGEVWHLLDTRVDLPVTLVDTERLQRVDLRDYTHVILVDGNYSRWSKAWVPKLREWVRAGGVLVATKRGAEWVTKQELHAEPPEEGAEPAAGKEAKEAKEGKEDKDSREGKADKVDKASGTKGGKPDAKANAEAEAEREADEAERFRPYGNFADDRAQRQIGGAIFQVILDPTHPIGYGYGDARLPVFRDGTLVFDPSENPYETVARYPADPLLGGFTAEARLKEVAGSAAIVATRIGRGLVVRMADNPNFRGVWYGTNKLFLNALFFGPLVDPTKIDDDER